MLFPIWIPIIATIITLLYWFVPNIPGFKDEILFTIITLGLWGIYFGVSMLEDVVDRILSGDVTALIVVVIIVFGIWAYIKYFKTDK